MFFNLKKTKSTQVIDIQADKLSISEGITISKVLIKLAKNNNKHLVINFNNSMIFDNLFINKLLFAWKYCDRTNTIISFCGIKPDVLCVFYMLKLDEYFEFYGDKNDAILRKNRLVKKKASGSLTKKHRLFLKN